MSTLPIVPDVIEVAATLVSSCRAGVEPVAGTWRILSPGVAAVSKPPIVADAPSTVKVSVVSYTTVDPTSAPSATSDSCPSAASSNVS